LGHREQAAERYRQVIEMDRSFVDAWNNLGNVLAELEDHGEAIEALQTVLRLDPGFADAHYNLADVLEQAGRHRDAARHWRAFLQRESHGPWPDYARPTMQA